MSARFKCPSTGDWVHIDSERYAAMLRTRYRKFLFKRGVPLKVMSGLKTKADFFEFAKFVVSK